MEEDKNTKLEFVYELFKAIKEDNHKYIYRGFFNRAITESILSLAETNIVDQNERSSIKKRVYHIMVESLQNITRHQSVNKQTTNSHVGIFFIQKKDLRYFVTTGNLIANKDIFDLRKKLEQVNNVSQKELKQMYKNRLIHGVLSEKGGAGLGLIDMARKSGNKLLYNFKTIDSNNSYFYLHTEIPSGALNESGATQVINSYSLERVTSLHSLLNRQNILIIFNNYFRQNSLMTMLPVIESYVTDHKETKKRMFNIIVEMFQNIVHHGQKEKDTDRGNHGLFFISETDTNYMLNSGNYILNSKTESLKGKLEYLNNLQEEELDDYYTETLLDFNIDSVTHAGLGFIDMRIKSKNPVGYDFYQIDNEKTFFTLQINLDKNNCNLEETNVNI